MTLEIGTVQFMQMTPSKAQGVHYTPALENRFEVLPVLFCVVHM